ncbi:FtsQ-type POTRA domain-containing protein [Noviherbaspirillum cavernae]|uniref:Cell division protein FtsQ n=1 Tax=Noviherbaspirillum cavernae TaxID=2320862 RepID=A0A418WXX2_9BURK|nr:cell division protein FtsQ/DivIB [Noviherbaspirillum cavernae]RJG05052.1 FtsQ-type POTRA domain-containing protein [Noviherbaspirillum cavernae]
MWHDVRMLNATTNALLGLLALSLLASGVWWLTQRPIFTLKVITIQGMQQGAELQELRHVSASTVRNTAVPHIKGNFFTTDLNAVRQAFEAVPWVRKASVRREWPNRLIVSLEEHEPLGTWGDDGRLLSAKGDVFTANLAEAEEDGELVEFRGPEGSEKEVVVRYRELQQWFAPVKLEPESLQLSGRYAWTVKLNNGMTVELGREQSSTTLKDRVDRLVGIYPELVARLQDRIESVDMRYPNGLALKAHGLVFGLDKKGLPRGN